jgi:hypothetical protein
MSSIHVGGGESQDLTSIFPSQINVLHTVGGGERQDISIPD